LTIGMGFRVMSYLFTGFLPHRILIAQMRGRLGRAKRAESPAKESALIQRVRIDRR